MHRLTRKRVKKFYQEFSFAYPNEIINLVDVGSGGDLKDPWKYLPDGAFKLFGFEPLDEDHNKEKLPLCISNSIGISPFYVANNERDSSFHKVLSEFVLRYNMEGMLAKKIIDVNHTTLDEQFKEKYDFIDAFDINTEGHDFQVLQGADALISRKHVKLIKIEFEFAPVYEKQYYFADIDLFLRNKGYQLGSIQIDYEMRPYNIPSKGEPVTGKAIYCFSNLFLEEYFKNSTDNINCKQIEFAKLIKLYICAELPGYCKNVIEIAQQSSVISETEAEHLINKIRDVFYWSVIEEKVDPVNQLFRTIIKKII